MSSVVDLTGKLKAKWQKLSDDMLAERIIYETCPTRGEALRLIAHQRGWLHVPVVVAMPDWEIALYAEGLMADELNPFEEQV